MDFHKLDGFVVKNLHVNQEPGHQTTSIDIVFTNGVEMRIFGHEGTVGYLVDASISSAQGGVGLFVASVSDYTCVEEVAIGDTIVFDESNLVGFQKLVSEKQCLEDFPKTNDAENALRQRVTEITKYVDHPTLKNGKLALLNQVHFVFESGGCLIADYGTIVEVERA